MLAGRIRCDFCGFIGDMEFNSVGKTLKVPTLWITVTPMITVHGMRGLKYGTKEHKRLDEIKERVKKKVAVLHCCPACVSDRDVFDLKIALPAAPEREVSQDNYMRSDHASRS